MTKIGFLFLFITGVSIIIFCLLAHLRRRIVRSLPLYRVKRRKRINWQMKQASASPHLENKTVQLLIRAGFSGKKNLERYLFIRGMIPAILVAFLMLNFVIKLFDGLVDIRSFPYVKFIMLGVLGWYAPVFYMRWKVKQRAFHLSMEVVRFSDRLLMSLQTKSPLFYSIRRAGRTTRKLKPYIDLLLHEWVQENPKRALHCFGERIAIDEILPLINALLVIVDQPNQAQYLMEQQMKSIETIRDFTLKQKIKAKPVYMILLGAIPFTAGMIALLAPWYSETIRQLHQIF